MYDKPNISPMNLNLKKCIELRRILFEDTEILLVDIV